MSQDRSWRERLLRQGERVPSLNDGFIPSFRVYLRGNSASAASFGSLFGELAKLQSPVGYRVVIPDHIEQNLEEGLLVRHNVQLNNLLWGRVDAEDELRAQLFDTIQAVDEMLADLSPDGLRPDFADFVNTTFARENQPYELREGQVVDRHAREQWEVVEGLEALAPDEDLRKIVASAVRDFFDPRENRRESGLMYMALAFDAAKKRLGADAKDAFRILADEALSLPAVAGAEQASEAWTRLFTNLNDITQEMIRHGAPDRPTPKSDATAEFLFFSLAATVRLLLVTRQRVYGADTPPDDE